MEANAVIARQPKGRGKMKNEPAQGQNRRVLCDIGNMETLPVVEGKISRPMTRSFCAQLQAAADKNKLVVVDDIVAAATKKGRIVKKPAEPQKKASEIANNDLVVISSDEEENVKEVEAKNEKIKPVGEQSSKERSLRRNDRTFTSVLTARSKAACGITDKPKDLIVNIDAPDVNDDLAVVEYVDDIYMFYKLTEEEGRVHDYMVSQANINAKMRTILVDWLIEVHNKFKLMPETLYLTVNILDRYLSMKTVNRRELQLVGISSMLIACKYEEIWAPQVNDFICISDYAYIGSQMENLVFFLAELGISHYPTVICYCPSMLAAASVYAAHCTLNKSPLWTETLKHHTGYSEEQLKDCAKLLVSFHLAAAESEQKLGVYKKFSSHKRGAVALLNPAEYLMT
ncbi:Cyclin-B1-2 [Citrus sinensis]|uniref:Cyclin-B1-2 n=1 Tax=Citrus sinensis TaxID=2711 RepID=A0ACB8MUT9_CITSI|nr:G2/mitotic-specific cyclin S13-7 isoform X2 [Citrus sinensis]KAH9741094.1 Cyclin-B1-2 [Citrus sinensis]KAH9789584.1 cyclin-B1-2 [Citrus sinensis]